MRPPGVLSLAKKLGFLFDGTTRVLEACRPAAVSVETVFAAKNIASAVKLAQELKGLANHRVGVEKRAYERCRR